MTDKPLDVLAIGNAIVDVIADADDAFLAAQGLDKGSMRLVDEDEAVALYGKMGPGRESSGGSAGNTVAGLAALGLSAGFIGQVADDELGKIFAHDLRATGVEFGTATRNDVGASARCLILVTPDAQRTMNTFLGAAQRLPASAISAAHVASARILYLEGYLWDPEEPRAAMEAAIDAARAAGTRVAFSLSDAFCISRHRDGFNRLIDDGRIDILFANEDEILSLTGAADFDSAVAAVAPKVPVLAVTRGAAGAVAVSGEERAEVAAEPIAKLVDTTGAGDLFAAGFLAGQARGASLQTSLKLGAIAAAEVIQHYGARPEADLRKLAGELL